MKKSVKEILMNSKKRGIIWEISELVTEITYKTSRIGKPSELNISCIKKGLYQNAIFGFENGDVIRFRMNGVNLFYGYIFKISIGADEQVTLTCYDQTRYLNSNDTYVFKGMTATDVIRRIAGDLQLSVGTLADTGYVLPPMAEDDKKLMDIICKALDTTLIATHRNYVLFDDFGSLTLKNINDMRVDAVIGDKSLMTDFDYERSIDGETYNRVKVVQDNKETKRRDVYIAQDSANIAKWGRLQLFRKVDEKLNSAQAQEIMNNLIELHNREQRKIRIDAIGDLRIRAGCFIPIVIKELEIKQYFLIDECSHKFEGEDHTMTLDLKVI
ncbi:XkdQ/YqbQ family protein [Paenibacillus larvae]|uniref:XkdQ/YqbQ family protein n=1 Tax=Paenibacillus larvae TaxID=1464 RepID=UPI0030C98064